MPSNDNDGRPPATVAESGAYGQAAHLLVESLIHRLITESVITNVTAVEVVTAAIEVEAEIAGERGDSAWAQNRSLGILQRLAGSLETDVLG